MGKAVIPLLGVCVKQHPIELTAIALVKLKAGLLCSYSKKRLQRNILECWSCFNSVLTRLMPGS